MSKLQIELGVVLLKQSRNNVFSLVSLSDEMKTFAGQQIEPLFQFSWLIVFLTLLLCGGVGLLLAFTVDPNLGIAVSLSFLALLYIFFSKSLLFYLFLKCRKCQDSLFYLKDYLYLS